MNNKKSIPVLDARTIFFEYLTEQEEQAIERGRKEVDYLLEPAYKLLDHLPPNVLEDASDAIELAIGGGEANGFCAGFYYALRMMEGLRSGAVQYYAPEQAKGGAGMMNAFQQLETTKAFAEHMTGRKLDPHQAELLRLSFTPWDDEGQLKEMQQAAKDEQARRNIYYIACRMNGQELKRLLTFAMSFEKSLFEKKRREGER